MHVEKISLHTENIIELARQNTAAVSKKARAYHSLLVYITQFALFHIFAFADLCSILARKRKIEEI